MPSYRPKKRLGQNFLKSPDIIKRILAEINSQQGRTVVEVGAGKGALTKPLVASGADVIAVEFDRDLMPYLKKLLGDASNLRLVNIDFLNFDPGQYDLDEFDVIGNLPYNISSPVLDWCVTWRMSIKRAVFMVQREVAARVAADPGNKDWSPLSIFTQLYFRVNHCFDVAPKHFSPPPQVVSSVITMEPVDNPPVPYPALFEDVVRQAFRHRRKLLTNNLVPSVVASQEDLLATFEQLDLYRTARAEELSTATFLELTRLLVENKMVQETQ